MTFKHLIPLLLNLPCCVIRRKKSANTPLEHPVMSFVFLMAEQKNPSLLWKYCFLMISSPCSVETLHPAPFAQNMRPWLFFWLLFFFFNCTYLMLCGCKLCVNCAEWNIISPPASFTHRMSVCVRMCVCSMRVMASLTSMASCVHSASVLPSFGKTSESWVLNIIAVFLRCLRLSFFFSVFLSEWVQKTQTSSPHFLFYRSLSIRLISLCLFSLRACAMCHLPIRSIRTFDSQKCWLFRTFLICFQ